MIIFLLLVIIAIMLLGASRFLGVVAAIAGFVGLVLAAFFGLYLLASAMGMEVDDIFMPTMLMLGFASLVGWAAIKAKENP